MNKLKMIENELSAAQRRLVVNNASMIPLSSKNKEANLGDLKNLILPEELIKLEQDLRRMKWAEHIRKGR